ncbi:hypothetical protein ACFFMN_42540 [Planobispora siamensis]|uniref:Uncharacterized protein n=1 Tax=Planobispora siamensis TaxID=936338 RepID=A0A8J3SQY2_9ACTN|nr:hypothetical protein [Planobispora siamensis]GIH97724.1 hypothetical protein Psi01_83540 [Planobispora siamensis]
MLDRADAVLLEQVHTVLRQAGFALSPAPDVEGGLSIRSDPGRGVVISWTTAAEVTVKNRTAHQQVAAAVHLALLAIMTGAGYAATGKPATGEVVITGVGHAGEAALGR